MGAGNTTICQLPAPLVHRAEQMPVGTGAIQLGGFTGKTILPELQGLSLPS